MPGATPSAAAELDDAMRGGGRVAATTGGPAASDGLGDSGDRRGGAGGAVERGGKAVSGGGVPVAGGGAKVPVGWFIGVALVAALGGVVLRFWNLGDQILGGDELHAVRAALAQPLAALLTTYQLADSCIPLTALDRWLLDHGWALDEWRLRAPVLAAGLAAMVVLPALARRRLAPVAPAAGALFACLVAVSPLLVLYSRIARSYMPATLLAFVAVMAFERWWTPRSESLRIPGKSSGVGSSPRAAPVAAGCYVLAAALAAWFHLGTAPIVCAPLLFAAGDLALIARAAGKRRRGAIRGPSHLAGGTGGPPPQWEASASGQAVPPGFEVMDAEIDRPGRSVRSLAPEATARSTGGSVPKRGAPVPRVLLRHFVSLAAVTAGLGAACALFLVPALPSLLRLVAAKRQAQSIPAGTWLDVLQLQAGARAGQGLAAVLFWGFAVVGLVGLLRRRPRLGAYLLTVVAGQLLGILVLSPLGLARPQVLDRYLLPALPVVLLWVATGLAAPWWRRQERLGRLGQRWGAAGLVVVWLAAGPFVDADFRASAFMHHNDLVAFAVPTATLPPGELPAAYRALGGPPGTAIVELPWPPVWDFGRCFYVYQAIHGLRVLVAAPGTLVDGRLLLRNRVDPDPAALRASGARWVVVHRHLAVEEARLRQTSGASSTALARRAPAALAAQLAADGAHMAAVLTAAWGPPLVADADVSLWDLHRLPSPEKPAAQRISALLR